MNYYNEIKDTLIKNQYGGYGVLDKKAKDYSKNKSDLNSYYEVGRLLIEAQGGEERAKYGNKIIKEYSLKLTKELGKGYSTRNLKYMRQFYLLIQKGQTVSAQLTWSHYTELLRLSNLEEINYYIYIIENQNLSIRELREKIKTNEYERIGYKEELEKPKVNTLIKNPVVIKSKNIPKKITEYVLHNLILENMDDFLKELGIGFAYIGHKVKIKIGKDKHSIDFLLFNYKFNCFVVVEIKTNKAKYNDCNQLLFYKELIDRELKEEHHNETIGILISKEYDAFIIKYTTDKNILTVTYEFAN